MTSDSKPAFLIETLEDLECLAERLADVPRVAVDLESDSFYTYHPKVCLLQMSSDAEDYIIDPLTARDLSPLGPIFRNPKVEKVFHAAEYDIQCLKRDYGFEINHLFDTMAVSRILGAHELGLAALIHKYFGIKLSKKLQRADWGRRPLSLEQIEYARMDTHFLLPLRDILYEKLQEKDRWLDAQDEFDRLEQLEAPERSFNPDDFWRLSGARLLPGQSRAVLKDLYYYREKMAAELDKAPFRVLPEPLMVRLAGVLPKDSEALANVHGMTPYLFQKFGDDILQLIRNGLAKDPIESPPEHPRRPAIDVATMRRFQSLRLWRKNKAIENEVDSIVILTTPEIKSLAHAPANGGEPSGWLNCLSERKRQLYGEDILKILSRPDPEPAPKKKRKK